jgi:asparagine synthase (glutamine-hydrolysing)
MCGIAGIFYQNGAPVSEPLLRAMTDVLAHRGPDGSGFYRDGPVGLGHRRLAIIDLVTGGQPMGSDDGTVWLAYNGEIYNFRELRRELEARGATFRTTSDTEVLLRGYEAWGRAVLPRLRGMFAFALWDGRRRELLLARDRLGIKPLVYSWDGVCLRFASELKALLQDPAVPRTLDWEALRDYFTHLYIPAPARRSPPVSPCLPGLAPSPGPGWKVLATP